MGVGEGGGAWGWGEGEGRRGVGVGGCVRNNHVKLAKMHLLTNNCFTFQAVNTFKFNPKSGTYFI